MAYHMPLCSLGLGSKTFCCPMMMMMMMMRLMVVVGRGMEVVEEGRRALRLVVLGVEVVVVGGG